ncbi:bifunctional glycosyltransferase family 2/GtrA family protein [Desulfonatronum sp. SC1]|uniref:bifunctional glycosyltransferase family 2/GtrA family protein n=1 Tax=Desulfonatronum sp. SC1 TaxID=2109626 RepID=UPI000D326A5D|nr:bifunctional glycosyltransferase family 2/GtrA family protein [Desulfonatronum sp. SC1]PTN36486.1 glycosyl transferase [Desulfonatronum sp. SC1]
MHPNISRPTTLTLVIPCFNEERTLEHCIERVQAIADEMLSLELIIVDDCSQDNSVQVAQELARRFTNIRILRHDKNQGKGAALRTGFAHATGEFVGVQDADLEYDPQDFRRLICPLVEGRADVVFGSRYLYSGERRVLYFWHSQMNRVLTFLSNMFSDLGLTDMETCYKLFRREIIQSVEIQENRFGFEPEIVAKVGEMRCRVYEMPISYHGRTYAEGKKINWKDGLRALYCILHYGAHRSPLPMQFLVYLFIGGTAAIFNLILFLSLFSIFSVNISAILAFYGAAAFNYWLCIHLLFKKNIRWKSWMEQLVYYLSVSGIALIDLLITRGLMALDVGVIGAKLSASAIVVLLNFLARRFLVFPEKRVEDWK